MTDNIRPSFNKPLYVSITDTGRTFSGQPDPRTIIVTDHPSNGQTYVQHDNQDPPSAVALWEYNNGEWVLKSRLSGAPAGGPIDNSESAGGVYSIIPTPPDNRAGSVLKFKGLTIAVQSEAGDPAGDQEKIQVDVEDNELVLSLQNLNKFDVGLGDLNTFKNNYGSPDTPSLDDDITEGYSIGSIWTNNALPVETRAGWICTDNTATAAKWQPISAEIINALPRVVLNDLGEPLQSGGVFASRNEDVFIFRQIESTTGLITIEENPEHLNINVNEADLNIDASQVSNLPVSQNNLNALTNPTVNDDNTEGYQEGSIWHNLNTSETFIMSDKATNNAKWEKINVYNNDNQLLVENGGRGNDINAEVFGGDGDYISYYDGFNSIYKSFRENLFSTATIPPQPTDDQSKGYIIGSRWCNYISNKVYLCTDSTIGSAVWYDIETAVVPVVDKKYISLKKDFAIGNNILQSGMAGVIGAFYKWNPLSNPFFTLAHTNDGSEFTVLDNGLQYIGATTRTFNVSYCCTVSGTPGSNIDQIAICVAKDINNAIPNNILSNLSDELANTTFAMFQSNQNTNNPSYLQNLSGEGWVQVSQNDFIVMCVSTVGTSTLDLDIRCATITLREV